MFHEIDQDRIDRIRGMDITVRDHGDATTTRAGRCCATSASRSDDPN